MKISIPTLAGSILALFAGSGLHAQMSVDSLDGPVTATESSSFQNYVTGLTPAANNIGNAWVQGTSGEQTKAMGLMFETTGNVGILDQMIRFCDAVLSERNDLAASPTGQYTIWTGRIDPVWPNSTTAPIGTGGEQGDPVGHLAYCARLILQTPAIWNNSVGIGDPNGYGATYLARARTYVTQADYSMDHHILNSELDLSRSNQMWFAAGDPYKGGTQVPWNQVMMFTYPLQNLAVCHAILADDPTRLANYDAIVQANVNWYFGAGTTKYTDGAGNPAYNWAYAMPGTTGEDSNHGALDVAGLYRAYQSGRYGITSAMMQPLGNVVVDIMTLTVGSYYAGTVDGCTTCTGHAATTSYLRSGYFFTADFRSDQYYNMVSGLHITAPGTTGSVDAFSRLMFIKNRRYLAANNFALNATPSSASVNAGSAINYAVTVAASGSFSGTVNLSVSGLPAGATATLSPSAVNTSGNSVLTVTTSSSTPVGTYPLTITGSNGTIDDIQSIGVSLVVALPQVAAPSFSPGGGSYTSAQSVTISSSTAGASIRYTTDGSIPSETAGTLYSGPVTVSASETLKAIAYKTGYSDSTVTSAAFTVSTVTSTEINDTDAGVVYTGTWTYSSSRNLGDYQNDVHYTKTNGDSVSYTFTGSGISYVTETNTDEGNVSFYIDGVLQRTVSCASSSRATQQTVFTASGLVSGSHTLKAVKVDGTYMLLDALIINTTVVQNSNLAPTGTAYAWYGMSSSTATTNKTAQPGLNDGNLTADVDLDSAGDFVGAWEAAGVTWSSAKTISSANFINGTITTGGDGFLTANLALQYTTNGSTWSNTGWTISPAYPYSSAAGGQTYTASGTALSGVLGMRFVGQVRTTDTSYHWIVKEVQIIGH